jgi:phospholipid/cholesterol/gamma-HCH transport system permease protein
MDWVAEVGAISRFLARGARATRTRLPRRGPLLVQQMMSIGINSIPLVLVTSLFVGAVAAVQAAYQMHNLTPLRMIPTVIGRSAVIELGPVLTALVVAGRVSASIAAELGTMKVTEQVDAMEALAIDPIAYLVVPRVVAAVVMLPVITVFSDALALLGAYLVTTIALGVSSTEFLTGLRSFLEPHDVLGGLMKSFAFGFIIASMGCFYGFQTSGGAEGVGRSTTRAVVAASVLVLIVNYVLANVIFRGFFAGGA